MCMRLWAVRLKSLLNQLPSALEECEAQFIYFLHCFLWIETVGCGCGNDCVSPKHCPSAKDRCHGRTPIPTARVFVKITLVPQLVIVMIALCLV